MIWFIFALGIGLWILIKSKKKSSTLKSRDQSTNQRITSEIKTYAEVVYPNAEEWAKERETAKKEKQQSIDRLTKAFVRPANIENAFATMQSALSSFAQEFKLTSPDFDQLLKTCQTQDPKKTEQLIRKKITESYKNRTDLAQLIDSLALCLLHAKFAIDNPGNTWKVSPSIKRLVTNLDDEKYRSSCIGFLYLFGDATQSTNQEVVETCQQEIGRLFSRWQSDIQAKLNYEENLTSLSKSNSVSDKHFTLNSLIEYLSKRRRFDACIRNKLIELCIEDQKILKQFLADFASLGGEKVSFEKAVKSEHYFCPRLPSFDTLWEIYEEQENKTELLRLQKFAAEIKYGNYEDEEILAESGAEELAMTSESKSLDPCPVEYLEVIKSGQKGKLAFIDSEGNSCSTEDAAQNHLKNLGYKVIRGEVQFWQAMFGLAFWEEIFEGTDAPNSFNDIPHDLFSGDQFYLARKERIDQKTNFLRTVNVQAFITSQLRKHGGTWTRIIFDGGIGNFAYRKFLESAETRDFLKIIDPIIFSKIVSRIAENPNGNRAGPPDYSIWKNLEVSFIEVKGAREKIRESQINWLAWMHQEGIPVKIIRLKGIVKSSDSAA